MHIRTIAHSRHWEVRADWWGTERTVFTGTLAACLRYVAKHEER